MGFAPLAIVAMGGAFLHEIGPVAGQEIHATAEQMAEYRRYEALSEEARRLAGQGQWREAIAKLREALPVVEGVLGKVNPQSLYALQWASIVCEKNNDCAQSASIQKEVVALAEGLYPKQPWKIADERVRSARLDRMARFTSDDWKLYQEAGRQANAMIEGWQTGKLEPAYQAGLRAAKLHAQLLGPDDYFTCADRFLLGRIAYDGRDFAQAELLFQSYLEATVRSYGETHSQTAIAHAWIANAQRESGQLVKAVEHREKALAVSRQVLSPDDPKLLEDLQHLGVAYQSVDRTEDALKVFQDSLALLKQLGGVGSAAYALGLSNCGSACYKLGQAQDSRKYFVECLATFRKLPDEPDSRGQGFVAALSNYSALCREDFADYSETRRLLAEALDYCEKHPDDEGIADALPAVLNQRGLVESAVENWSAALDSQQRALELTRKRWGDDHPTTLTVLHDFGMLLWRAGYPAKAKQNLEIAWKGRVEALGPESEVVARSLSELSRLYGELGDRAKAVEYAEKSIQALRAAKVEDTSTAAYCYQNAALLLDPAQDFAQAVEWFDKSLEIRRKTPGSDRSDEATVLGNIAVYFADAGKLEQAIEYQRQSVALQRNAPEGETASAAAGIFNLAVLLQRRGAVDEARPLYAEAVAIAEKKLPPQHPHVATYLAHLAACEALSGDFVASWKRFERAAALREQTFSAELPALSAREMTGFVDELETSLDFALSLPAEVVPADKACQCVLSTKARVFNMLCRLKASERAARLNADFGERMAEVRAARERISRLTIAPPRDLDAAALAEEKAAAQRELNSAEINANIMASMGLPHEEPATAESVRGKLPAGGALVEFVKYSPFDFSGEAPSLARTPERYAAFLVFADESRPVARIDLGEAAPIDEAVAALREKVEEAAAAYKRSRGGVDEKALEADYRDVAQPLADLLFQPVANAAGADRLLFLAPDGPLHGLPFEALVDDQGAYLAEAGYRFVYLTSGRELLAPNNPAGNGTAVFAGPNYNLDPEERAGVLAGAEAKLAPDESSTSDGASEPTSERSPDVRGLNWESLPGFAVEGDAAAVQLNRQPFAPVQVFKGDQALEDLLKRVRLVRALVIVTHGFFLEPLPREFQGGEFFASESRGEMSAAQGLGRLRRTENPLLRSGLVLCGANRSSDAKAVDAEGSDGAQSEAASVEDGWLTAYEVAGLDLRGVELVVLSACNSGRDQVSSGESVAGLRTAFLAAGAKSLVASLFEVPDKETAELMQQFYGGVAAGKSPLDALHDAELAAVDRRRKQHGAAHPFFWASFVVAGRP
jgi:CHAT domain-containing protein